MLTSCLALMRTLLFLNLFFRFSSVCESTVMSDFPHCGYYYSKSLNYIQKNVCSYMLLVKSVDCISSCRDAALMGTIIITTQVWNLRLYQCNISDLTVFRPVNVTLTLPSSEQPSGTSDGLSLVSLGGTTGSSD